jgi:hypothetical protein
MVLAVVSLIYQIIPAEIMVAAFQDSGTAIYATASTATDARVYLEASEKGTDGIVLQTDDISEVFALKVRGPLFFFGTCNQYGTSFLPISVNHTDDLLHVYL